MFETVKNILVSLTEEGRNESTAALAFALSLAEKADAHLTVHAASLRLKLPSAMVSRMAAKLVAEENRRLAVLAERLASEAQREAGLSGISCSIEIPHLAYADLRTTLISQARVHDLSTFDAQESLLMPDSGLIESCLFESGRPILIVPNDHPPVLPKRVLIAWDGSARAARAVADALPFLKAAETVEIFTIVGEKDLSNSVPGADLAPRLAHHGIKVSVKDRPLTRTGDASDTLKDQIGLSKADMLVMGAYVHSRLQEWILGGLTRSMLTGAPVPLLMSH
ncbi:MAG TPA: universal stress protein [Terriglobia bacterium]|nr:universal stress protein [Terriglobia bacterium]